MAIQIITQIINLDPTETQPSGWNAPKINSSLPLDVIVIAGTGSATKYWFTSQSEIIRNQSSLTFDDQKNVIAISAAPTVAELNKIRDKPGRVSVIENDSNFRLLLSLGTAEPTAGLNLTDLTITKNGTTQLSSSWKNIFSAGIATINLKTFTGIEITTSNVNVLKLYEVRTQVLSSENSEQLVKVGYLACFGDNPPESLDEGYFFDLSINPAMLADGSLKIKENENNLLLVWPKFSTNSTSTFLEIPKAQLAASPVNSLNLENLLALEKKYKVDLNNDDFADGSIKLIAPDIGSPSKTSLSIQFQGAGTNVQTIEIFKLSNGDFVTPNKSDFLKSTNNSFTSSFSIDAINATFKRLSSSDVLSYETRQLNKNKIDINDDGIIGAAVFKTLVATDNFGIYQTTLGDIVYAEVPDLNNGDAINSPIAISFKTDDPVQMAVRRQLLSAEGTVAKIFKTGTATLLRIGALSSDPIGGEFSLKEVSFELKVTNNIPTLTLLTASPSATTLFNEVTSQRQAFLQKEADYSNDLNKDGVIGDSITEELATSASGSVYRLASGTVFFSTNTLLNVGDRTQTGDTKLFEFGYAPEKIFACNLVGTNLQLIYLNGSKFFSEIFTKSQTTQNYSPVSGSKVELSNLDLTQAEIIYAVDINDDGRIGDTIASVAFGYNSINPASQPAEKSQDVGLYSLTSKTPFLRDAYIVTINPSLKTGDSQPSQGAIVLKNNGGSADAYWSIPNNTSGGRSTVVAAGMFDDAKSSVRLVLKTSVTGNQTYSLVTFDKNGVTNTPRGNPLTKFALFNEEIKLQTDIDGDLNLGDTASRIASKNGFGIYHLNGSGSIVVRNDDGWDTESSVIRQNSIDFVELKNLNKSNWLPFGYQQSQTSQGYELKNSTGAAKINQVAFNADGTINVYVSRNIIDKNGSKNTLYNVEFNNKGITKNPAGTALTQNDIFKQELSKEIDINGDGFVGKPYLTLQVSSKEQVKGASGYVWANDPIFYKNNPTDQFASILIPDSTGPIHKVNLGGAGSRTILPNWSAHGSAVLESDAFYSNITKKSYFISSDNTYISATDSSGKLTFKTQLLYAVPRGIGDFNGDGQQDIAIWSPYDVSFSFFKGNGKGAFTPLQKFISPISFMHATASNAYMLSSIANINGDKFSDFIILQKNTETQNGYSTNGKDQLMVYTNKKGILSASEKFSFEGTGDLSSFVTADVNGDNRDDLIFVRTKTDTIEIALNSNGKFSANGEFINNFSLSGIYKPRQVSVADINGDGIKDIVTLAQTEDDSNQGIFAYFGKGGGEFLQAQMLASEKDMSLGDYSLELGRFLLEDLNSDGLPEVITNTIEPWTKTFILWNLSNVAYGSKKFNAPISSSLVTEMNYADFEYRMDKLGFDPKFYTSSSISSTNIETRMWDSYSMTLSPTSNGGQILISSGNSNSPDITFSVYDNTPIKSFFSSNTPIELVSESYLSHNKQIYAGNGSYIFNVNNFKDGWDYISAFSGNDRVVFSNAASAGLVQFDHYLALITTTDPGVSHGVCLNGLIKNGASINFSSGNFDSVQELNNLFPEKIVQIEPAKKNTISLKVPEVFCTGVGVMTLGEGNFKISFPEGNQVTITLVNFDAGDQLILPANLSGSFMPHYEWLTYTGYTNNNTQFHLVFNDISTASAANLIGTSNFAEFNALGFGDLI